MLFPFKFHGFRQTAIYTKSSGVKDVPQPPRRRGAPGAPVTTAPPCCAPLGSPGALVPEKYKITSGERSYMLKVTK